MKYSMRGDKHYIVASKFGMRTTGVYIFELKGNFGEKIELEKEIVIRERGVYSIYLDCIGNQIWYTSDTENKGVTRITII